MTKTDKRPTARPGVLLLLLACATLTVMAGATISPSLPGLKAHYADVPGAVALVPLILTIPGLAIAVSAPLFGVLVDRVDARKVLLGAILVYVVAGSSGLWLDGIVPILAGRVLLGAAVGAIMTSSTTLIANIFTGPERGRVLGYQSSAMGFGGVVFILTGGLLADLSWRGPFAVYLAPLILLPLVLRTIPARAGAGSADGAVGAGFPLRLAVMVYLGAFCTFLIFYTIPTQLPFLMQVLGSPLASITGIAIALITLVSALASLGFGRLRERVPGPVLGLAGFGMLAVAFAGMALAPSVWLIFVLGPFVGAALGVIMPNLTTSLMTEVPLEMRGRAMGFLSMSIFLAQFLSAFTGAALVALGGPRAAFWGGSILALCVALVVLLGRNGRRNAA
ncbi:MFS transporter [Oceanibium sediminis]|uniref:MFS transporter n=1 Tax=Oceanibium sediminis TaxID=2026339 RepID=UPI000DD4C696|nr:MFS transporter [Oceanibium sediminis]